MNFLINEDNLMSFLSEFDYISKKYAIDSEDNIDLYYKIKNYETGSQFLALSEDDYSSVKENVNLIYNSPEISNRFMRFYRLVYDKIVRQFLNISVLDSLFDQHFLEFEWDLHSSFNLKEHDPSYYRDHCIHQIKNLYVADIFLSDEFFFNSIMKIIKSGTDSKVATYIKKNIESFVANKQMPLEELQLLEEIINIKHGGVSEKEKKVLIYDHYIRYVTYASSYMAALFHDIGYPIEHFLNIRNRISNYLPSIDLITNGDFDNFRKITNILSESFLFKVVPVNEIETTYQKRVHGTLSALALLLHFYETGAIHSISLEKRVSIEVAALSIYDHTILYRRLGDEDSTYFKPVFSKNPIAYLLRLCDDSQEWGRIYFEIINKPELRFCDYCKTPFLEMKEPSNHDLAYVGKALPPNRKIAMPSIHYSYPIHRYECACGHSLEKPSVFNARKVALAVTCSDIEINFHHQEKYIDINLNYNLYDLLLLCMYSENSSKVRNKELKKLKNFVSLQEFGKYNYINIDYLYTNNPITLKAHIVGIFLNKSFNLFEENEINPNMVLDYEVISDDEIYDCQKRICSLFDKIDKKIKDIVKQNDSSKKKAKIGGLVKILQKMDFSPVFKIIQKTIEGQIKTSDLEEHIKENLKIYVLIYIFQRFILKLKGDYYSGSDKKTIKQDEKVYLKKCVDVYFEALVSSFKQPFENTETRILLYDTLTQFQKFIPEVGTFKGRFDAYFDYMTSDKGLPDIVMKYCSPTNEINNYKYAISTSTLDYYSDLYYFDILNQINTYFRLLGGKIMGKFEQGTDGYYVLEVKKGDETIKKVFKEVTDMPFEKVVEDGKKDDRVIYNILDNNSFNKDN